MSTKRTPIQLSEVTPSDLAEGLQALQTVVEFLNKEELTYTGGQGKIFYSPKEWQDRGEEYGCDSVLVVVHDGGDHAAAFNWDYCCHELVEKLRVALEKAGFFCEQCTSWYSAIYSSRRN